jgi:hypothetical protein
MREKKKAWPGLVRTAMWLLLLFLPAALPVTAPASPRSDRGRTPMPSPLYSNRRLTSRPAPYREDANFKKELNQPARVLTGAALQEWLVQELQEAILVEEAWRKRTVGLALSRTPAADLMAGLEELFGGRWELVEEHAWVFAPSPERARAAARRQEIQLTREGGQSDFDRAANERLVAFVRSFTPQQWARLEAGEKLAVQDLSPRQWAVLRESFILMIQDPNGPYEHTPHIEALEGRAEFWLKHDVSQLGDTALGMSWPPFRPPSVNVPDLIIMSLERQPNGTWAPPSRRRGTRSKTADVPLPGALEPMSSAPAEPADYRQDPRFQGRLSFSGGLPTGEALLKVLAEQVKTSFLTEGEWLKKPLRIVVEGRTAAAVMDEMAALTKRRWEQAGTLWVLAPERRQAEAGRQ